LSFPPGGIPAAVPTENWGTENVTEDPVPETLHIVRYPPGVQFGGVVLVVPVIVHPDGRRMEKPVTVNWLVLGFVIVSVTSVVFPPRTGFPLVVAIVGRNAFDA
jgi:hypothetical protein